MQLASSRTSRPGDGAFDAVGKASRTGRRSRCCRARNGRTCPNWSSARRPSADRIGVTTTQVSATIGDAARLGQRPRPPVGFQRARPRGVRCRHRAARATRRAREQQPRARELVVGQVRAADRDRVERCRPRRGQARAGLVDHGRASAPMPARPALGRRGRWRASGASGVTPATWNSADRAGRGGGGTERLQPVLAGKALQPVDHADPLAGRAAVATRRARARATSRALQRVRQMPTRPPPPSRAGSQAGEARSAARGRRSRRRCRGSRRSGWCGRPERSCRTRRRWIRPMPHPCPAPGRWPAWYGAQVQVVAAAHRLVGPHQPQRHVAPRARRAGRCPAAAEVERADVQRWRAPRTRAPPATRHSANRVPESP